MPQTRASVDWLRNELHISGPAADIARFQQAAAGSGVVPWVLDLARIEEDYFLPMAVPVNGARAISVAGARILARRLRDAIAVNQQRAVTRMLTDRSCPLDLQRLLPVPEAILCRGPDDPASIAWLRTHWGVAEPLRHVRALTPQGDRTRASRRGTGRVRIEFWSADWSPWPALRRLRQDWPSLRLALQPDYGDG